MLKLNRSYDPETNVLNVSIGGKLPERYRDKFNEPLAAYDFIQFLIDYQSFEQQLTPKKDRVCRFCKRDAKETTFLNTTRDQTYAPR